jgi:uncharacterized membrane protein YedE/YeeE
LLFGVGAAVNGGCALSTVSRFGDGELAMLLTLAAMLLGSLGFDLVFGLKPADQHAMVTTWPPPTPLLLALALLAGTWAVYESIRIWRNRVRGATAKQRILAGAYRLSAAAVVIGVCNGFLYFANGPWAFTSAIDRELHQHFGLSMGAELRQWTLLLALLSGAALSAAQRRRFRLDWKPRTGWLRNAAGGALMGVGTSMAPGGNDALILQALPSLSPHALPALVAMLGGILAVLAVRRSTGRAYPRIRCVDDTCVEEA